MSHDEVKLTKPYGKGILSQLRYIIATIIARGGAKKTPLHEKSQN